MLNAWLNPSKCKSTPEPDPERLRALGDKVSALKGCKSANQPLNAGCFIVFDTETTGLMPQRGDEIISVGALEVNNNRLTDRKFSKLVNPYREVPEPITRLTGITGAMANTGEDLVTVLDHFLEFAGTNPLVAHHSGFDLQFINLKLRKYFKQSLSIPVLDTYVLAQFLHPHRKSYCLDALAQLYRVPLEGRHSALGDAVITGNIFTAMVEELESRGIKNIRELLSCLKFKRLI